MIFKRTLLVYSVLFLWGSLSFGRDGQGNFIHKKFTTEHGLCHDYVHWITQDKTGFLWIATWDGVSRFDGYEFRSYFHEPEELNTLPFVAVNKILTDSMNNVWAVSASRPLARYDRARDCFVREKVFQYIDSLIWDMDIGSENILWILTEYGIVAYDPLSGLRSNYRIKFQNDQDSQRYYQLNNQIIADNKNELWLAGFNNTDRNFYIHKAEPEHGQSFNIVFRGVISVSGFQLSQIGNEFLNLDIHQSASGKTWFFSKFGLYLFHPEDNIFTLYTNPVNPEEFAGTAIYTWMHESSGLHFVDPFRKKHLQVASIPGYFLTSAYLDFYQTIWSGDLNQFRENVGLNHYIPVPHYFRHFLTDKDESGNNRLIFPVCQGPDGELWVGTRYADDLFRILKNGQVIRQSFYDQNIGAGHPRIRSMVSDSTGVWLGCTDNFLVRYENAGKNFKSYKINSKNQQGELLQLALHNILAVDQDLLINGGEGVYRYSPQNGSIELKYAYKIKESAFCFVKDLKDGYWIGFTANEIVHLGKDLKENGRYKLGTELNNVEHILPGDSSDVWIALMGGGLVHFYPESGKQEFYTTADGLANNTVYSLLKDKQGTLWISTNMGISHFNPKTGIFRNFNKEEGMLIREFNSDSWCQTDDGHLYFGGVGGMVGFHPDSIRLATETPIQAPLLITDFSVSGVPRFFEKAIYEMDTVILSKGDNNFQVKFASLDFRNPEKIRYRYRLTGMNEKWTETDYRNRMVSYAGLSHMHYWFQVQATDNNGEWKNQTSLLVIIPHSIHQTWWFRTLVALFFISVVSLFIILFMRQIRLKAKHRAGELKLESLRGQMNPHFIFNSLNSINYFISKNDKYSANHYIADFSRLIRSILHNLSSDYIPLEKEIESLLDYLKLEHLRFSDKFNYSLKHDTLGGMNNLLVFPGMVQPFVENAIWHGVRGLEERVGTIRVEFIPHDAQSVKCIIEDDGVGRKSSEIFKSHMPGKKSRGIGIVLERLRIINDLRKANYKVTIEDVFPEKEETGTRVIIDIPMKQIV